MRNLTFNLHVIFIQTLPLLYQLKILPIPFLLLLPTLPHCYYDELDEEQAWGIVNPIGSENHLPTAYESDWSIPSTAWGHSAGTGTSCLAGGHSDGWGADMNSCPPMNSTPAPRPPVSEAAVLDDAIVSEITRVMSDLELPPAHETHWSLPRSQAARPTPPKNSSTDVHGSLYYNCRETFASISAVMLTRERPTE